MAQAKRQSRPEDDQARFGVSMTEADEAALRGTDDAGAAQTGAAAESTNADSGAGADAGRQTSDTGKSAAQAGADQTGTAKTAASEPPGGKDGQTGDAGAKTVPLAALHEEREKRKELQKQIEALTTGRTEDATKLERLRQIVEKLNLNPQPQPETNPAAPAKSASIEETIDKDPVEAVRMTAAEIKVLADFKKQIEAGNAAALETRNVLDKTLELEQEFIKTAPDYGNASTYLRNSRAAELRAHGLPQSRINELVGQEAVDLAKTALARGENPAKVIYEAARSRGYQRPAFLPNEAQALQKYGADQETAFKANTPDYDAAMDFLVKSRTDEYKAAGFSEEQARQMTERDRVSILVNAHRANANPAERAYAIAKSRGYVTKAAADGSGASGTERAATPQASAEDGAAQIARMKRGQEAAMSLGGANGSARGKTGIDALLEMSDAEFAAALGKMSPAQQRAYFGE